MVPIQDVVNVITNIFSLVLFYFVHKTFDGTVAHGFLSNISQVRSRHERIVVTGPLYVCDMYVGKLYPR